MEDWDIRYTQFSDQPYLLKWLEDSDDLRYFPMSTKKEAEDLARNWIGFSRYHCSLTALIDNKPCGIVTLFLMPYRKLVHHASFFIIVDKKHRRKGIGSSLLKNVINLAKNYFRLEILHAEVYEGCLLIPLLESFSFKQCAYQEKFVKEKDRYLARILFELSLKEVKL